MQEWKSDVEQPTRGVVHGVARVLAAGGVVALPTDTFYGLAADCRSEAAIGRVLRLKGRGPEHPLLLLVADVAAARRVAASTDARFDALAAAFWPGPLTLVLPAANGLGDALVGPTGGVAVRVPACPLVRQVARALGAPLTGTSANRTGTPPAAERADIRLDTSLLSGIVDGGRCPGGRASTLVELVGDSAQLLRRGPIGADRIRETLAGRLV